jgi:hypothetical protein
VIWSPTVQTGVSADIGSRNTVPMVLPRMSDIRCVAAVATAWGGSSYTTEDTGTATATTACPAATDATRAPAAAGAATITIDNFSYGEPLTVSPPQLSASPIQRHQ